MARIAGVSRVKVVSGYVLKNQVSIKRKYRQRDVAGAIGHAWNEVQIDGRKFYVDTTFMARNTVTPQRRVTSLNHKFALNKNGRQNNVNENINDFFFDFTPKSEILNRMYPKLGVSGTFLMFFVLYVLIVQGIRNSLLKQRHVVAEEGSPTVYVQY